MLLCQGCCGDVYESGCIQLRFLCGCCGVFFIGISIVFDMLWGGMLLGFCPIGLWRCGFGHASLLDALVKRVYNLLEFVLCIIPLCRGELGLL